MNTQNNNNELPSFHYAFQMSRKVIFNVSYYLLGGNKEKYFSTSADQFNQPKTDFNTCGQAQKELLKGHSKAMKFYNKWDFVHIKDLTVEQYNEMVQDIEGLKDQYNFIFHDNDRDISFSEERELSMQPVKKTKRAIAIN